MVAGLHVTTHRLPARVMCAAVVVVGTCVFSGTHLHGPCPGVLQGMQQALLQLMCADIVALQDAELGLSEAAQCFLQQGFINTHAVAARTGAAVC